MTTNTHAEPPVASPVTELFNQSVVQGSSRYWAAHFTGREKTAVQAALCFAHAMDMLTTANSEVIAEKSVWWHEELTDCTAASARHPITQALLAQAAATEPTNTNVPHDGYCVTHALHSHLHGALMSQQRIEIDTTEAWDQYVGLRFGSFHELLALASGTSPDAASKLGTWAAQLHSLGIQRAPELYQDPRLLRPPVALLGQSSQSLKSKLRDIKASQPAAGAANQVIIDHELAWWKHSVTHASPFFTGLPTGLRGMLSGWQAARKARSF